MSDNSHYVNFAALVLLVLAGCESSLPPAPVLEPFGTIKVTPNSDWFDDGVRVVCECPCGETHGWEYFEPADPFFIALHAMPDKCWTETISGRPSTGTVDIVMQFSRPEP